MLGMYRVWDSHSLGIHFDVVRTKIFLDNNYSYVVEMFLNLCFGGLVLVNIELGKLLEVVNPWTWYKSCRRLATLRPFHVS